VESEPVRENKLPNQPAARNIHFQNGTVC